MTDRELMQQALEALEVATTPLAKDRQEVLRAQAALRERLAQPEQEPVGWRFRKATFFDRSAPWHFIESLEGTEGLQGLEPLYTAPQPRQWQGLTEEEIGVAFRKAFPVGGVVFTTEAINFYRAIEAKLREKNA